MGEEEKAERRVRRRRQRLGETTEGISRGYRHGWVRRREGQYSSQVEGYTSILFRASLDREEEHCRGTTAATESEKALRELYEFLQRRRRQHRRQCCWQRRKE